MSLGSIPTTTALLSWREWWTGWTRTCSKMIILWGDSWTLTLESEGRKQHCSKLWVSSVKVPSTNLFRAKRNQTSTAVASPTLRAQPSPSSLTWDPLLLQKIIYAAWHNPFTVPNVAISAKHAGSEDRVRSPPERPNEMHQSVMRESQVSPKWRLSPSL